MSERENLEKERQKKKPRQKEERRKECVRSWRASEADDHFSIFSWNCRDYFFPTLSTCAGKIAGCAPPAHRQLWWKVIMKVCQGGCQNLRLSPSTSAPGGFSHSVFGGWTRGTITCHSLVLQFVWNNRYWQVLGLCEYVQAVTDRCLGVEFVWICIYTALQGNIQLTAELNETHETRIGKLKKKYAQGVSECGIQNMWWKHERSVRKRWEWLRGEKIDIKAI